MEIGRQEPAFALARLLKQADNLANCLPWTLLILLNLFFFNKPSRCKKTQLCLSLFLAGHAQDSLSIFQESAALWFSISFGEVASYSAGSFCPLYLSLIVLRRLHTPQGRCLSSRVLVSHTFEETPLQIICSFLIFHP